MSYKKSAEEKKWLKWKQKEENELRALGVDEAVIARLHASDWQAFNAERRYRQQQTVSSPFLELQTYNNFEQDTRIFSVQNLLDSIENEDLLNLLTQTDKLTLQILLLKMSGYSGKQIEQKTGINEFAVKQRIYRLRQKIKKYF